MKNPCSHPNRSSNRIRSLLTSFLVLMIQHGVSNAAVVEVPSQYLGWTIPDDTTAGVLHSLTLGTPGNVESVSVRLRLSVPEGGTGWLGDLYVQLEHDSGISVLLNRVGRAADLPFGYADRGAVDVVFSDSAAAGDIHRLHAALAVPESAALDGPITGMLQPDGRIADPSTVTTGSPRTALLGGFSGHAVSGSWNLFLADLSGGGQYRLEDWSLSIDVNPSPIPEPPTTAGVSAGLLVAGLLVRRFFPIGRNGQPARRSRSLPDDKAESPHVDSYPCRP